MDLNELVRTITQEVLKQINNDKQAEKECVMVLDNRDSNLVVTVEEQLGENIEVLFLDDEPGGRKPARYVLPSVSCSMMADLAAGKASGYAAQETLRLLLSGAEVEALDFEYKSYGDTAPGPLFSLYENYEKTLESYGLKKFVKKQPDTVRLRKDLVTENDVIQAQENGASVLWVPSKANVTALALECAKNLNVDILKR